MKRRIVQALAVIVLALLVAGFAAPFLHANRYRDRIQTSLSTALGRDVTVGDIRLDLFTGPGFRVSNVIIGDDPAISAEPFAYVEEMTATPRLLSLWTGRLDFSSLVLDGAHLNLARTARASAEPLWNFEPLLRPNLLAAFPSIKVRGSRINFKFEGRKSPFYLLNADLDVMPHSANGSDWGLRFTGEPARTDRPAHGFGALEARGRWTREAGNPGHLELDVGLERSEISDMVSLVKGYDPGVHGIVSCKMHVAGTIQALGLEGEVRIAELHGWDQSPPPGGVFVFRVSGTAATPQQHLELLAEPRGPSLITAHLTLDQYLQQPNLLFSVRSESLPVTSLPVLLRNFGARIPEGLRMAGNLQGEVRYGTRTGWAGEAQLRDASVEPRDVPPLRFDQVSIALKNDQARLEPVSMISGTEEIGQVAAAYSLSDGSYAVDLSSQGGPLAGLLHKFPVASVPLLSNLKSGNWNGTLRYAQSPTKPGQWTGAGLLTEAVGALPEISVPLRIASAHVRLDGPAVQLDHMNLRVEDTALVGDYRYAPAAAYPHQFHLIADELDLGQVEKLFRPVLARQVNLIDLALTLGHAAGVPDWLRAFHAEGSLQVGQLNAAGAELDRVRTHVQWQGTEIVLSDLQSRLPSSSAALTGRVAVDVANSAPTYAGTARISGVGWQNGQFGGDLQFLTSGSGLNAIANLKVNGKFEGRGFELSSLGTVEHISGAWDLSFNAGSPRLQFPRILAVMDGETWTGSGASDANPGDIVLTLTSKGKQISLAGSVTDPAKAWVER